jgi:hypothetical protein
MKKKKRLNGILLLKDHNESEEIDFELNYLLSLTTEQRFRMMETKSKELKRLLEQNGHRTTFEIIKHQ